jgi:hypothetical protein
MANSDKNILITPSVGLSTNPTIRFNGANNTPTTLRVLDDGTVSFEGTAGQLFSISDGLTGSIFSINDISGIPSVEVLDTGLVKINQYGGSTVFGSATAIQNSSLVNSKVSISTVSASTPGLIIKAAASQTANLQEWQNSSGTVLANVSSSGQFLTPRLTITNGGNIVDSAGTTPYFGFGSNQISLLTRNAAYKGLVIQGSASQTANLQEWQNSAGTILTAISSSGVLKIQNIIDQNNSGSTLQFSSTSINTYTFNPATIPFTVNGAASQTADLQQWKNSAGTVLAKITADGGANFAGTNVDILAGTGNFTIRNSGTTAYYTNSSLLVGTGYSAGIGVIIRGNGSQTADLQQWQHSDGNTYARITTYGQLSIGDVNPAIYANARISLNTVAANAVGMVIRGVASQTANLQEWQNNAGSVLARFDPYGYFNAYGYTLPTSNGSFESAYGGAFLAMKKTTSAVANPAADVARMYLVAGTNAGTLKLVIKAGTAGAETTILDNIPQS